MIDLRDLRLRDRDRDLRDALFVANLRTFLAYLLQAWKIWWRTKNDKYEVWTKSCSEYKQACEKICKITLCPLELFFSVHQALI